MYLYAGACAALGISFAGTLAVWRLDRAFAVLPRGFDSERFRPPPVFGERFFCFLGEEQHLLRDHIFLSLRLRTDGGGR